jgi:3-deoxy-D-manno-octulosonic-acid transferase
LIAFTKTEVWPVLAREAAERSTLLALVAATLPAGSSRLSRVARPVLRPAFTRLAAVHAITDEDIPRFELLGVDRAKVTVTGDPGIDSAAERAAQADPEAAYLKVFASKCPRIVAGSTWQADENVLLPAMRLLREGPERVQIVIAPHEPDAAHVAALVERLRNEGWQPATLTEAESAGCADAWNAVVVDRVGILAHLYTVATIAYVGGGFHDKGLHSVLEPAAAGVPVCFGPRHHNAHAADKLVQAGGARVSRGAGELFKIMSEWIGQRKRREAAGEAAAAYVQRHRGASRRSADLLLEAVGTRS